MTAFTAPARHARRSAAALADLPIGWGLATLAACGFAVLLRLWLPTNVDVSWLIDVAERVASGARLYENVFEVNPPLSILLYVPPVAFGRVLGVSSECATDLFVFFGATASTCIAVRLELRLNLIERRQIGPVVFVLMAALLILPMHTFAEREHIAVMACLPALVCCAGRLRGRMPDLAGTVLAGLGLGLAVSIKPIFALAVLGPVLCLLLRQGWRAVLSASELWIGAVFAVAYGAGIVLLLPAFAHTMLPIAVAVYVPAKLPLTELLGSRGLSIWLLIAYLLAARWILFGLEALPTVLLVASAGFDAAFVIQGKGFAYHAYPAFAVATLALCAGMLLPLPRRGQVERQRLFRVAQPAVLVFACASGMNMMSRHYEPSFWTPGLDAGLKAIGPHPRVLGISPEIAIGHPFVRDLGGTWVGSAPSTWISGCAQVLIAAGRPPADFAPYIALEESIYARDIVDNRPDVILIDDEIWHDWSPVPAAVSDALAPYEQKARFGRVTLWEPKNDHATLRSGSEARLDPAQVPSRSP